MIDAKPNASQRFQKLVSLPCPSPWEACILPVSGFPVPETELSPIRGFVERLTQRVEARSGVATEVFIQMAQLHLGDGPARLSGHGRDWIPAVGLGVWPNREPPTIWTKEDFENLMPGEAPRNVMYQVFRVTTGTQGCANARNVMLGLGTILQIVLEGDPQSLMEAGRRVLLPPIKDPSYTCFPFYIPLLDGQALRCEDGQAFHSWMCGASLYIRESHEDKGVLIISKAPLATWLEPLGARRVEGPEPGWRIPE